MRPTALLITDVQADFLPGGPLGVTDGHQIIPSIIENAKAGFGYGAYVFTQDWHPADHCSFDAEPKYEDGSWPVHCVQGTPGAQLDPAIAKLKLELEANHRKVITVLKGQLADHEAYSPFDDYAEVIIEGKPRRGGLATVLEDLGIEAIVDVGLAADYCVMYGAIGAQILGFETTVPVELTRPVGTVSGMRAVASMVEAGVSVE